MAIEFDCPACEATIRVKDEAAGKKGRCPKCRALLLIPELGPDDDEPVEDELTVLPEPTPPPAPVPEQKDARELPPEVAIVNRSASPDPISLADIQIQANVLEPAATTRISSSRRSKRKAQRGPIATSKLISVAAATLGLAAVVGVGWYLYSKSRPDLSGELLGERLRTLNLATVYVPPPVEDVPIEKVESVLADLRRSELPLKSEYVVVVLAANERDITVDVSPGPRSVAIRVPLKDHMGVQAAIKEKRDEITKLKHRELRAATSSFVNDFADFLTAGLPMTKLPEYRNQVALNASVSVAGYSIEALVGQTPFPCVYEDAEGGCYFFPPENTTSFRIRGRKLSNGRTLLPVDFAVKVVDAQPTPSVEPSSPPGDKESTTTEPEADGAPPSDSPESEAMKNSDEAAATENSD